MPLAPASAETRLVLDTVVFTHWRNKHPYVLAHFANYFKSLKELPALTSMTVFEAISGVEKELAKGEITEERAQQYRNQIEELGRGLSQLAFDTQSAAIAAFVYHRLTKSDRNKHWQDLFIAATAVAHGYGVATSNSRDFDLIARHLPPGNSLLRLAIWKP